MFKSSLVLASLAVAAISSKAHAEFYTCIFTEPFVTVVYDTAHETVTTNGFANDGTVRSVVTTDIVYRPNKTTGEINLVNNKGVTLFTLTETGKGSDGMSDAVYPFDVTAKSSQYLPKNYLGGCYSDAKPKIVPAP